MRTFYNSKTYVIFGLSTDTKPILEALDSNGSLFNEIDTGNQYRWDAEEKDWYLQPKSGGGGGGGSTEYTAGNYITIKGFKISVDFKELTADLATVATTGSYNDLADLPELSIVSANTGETATNTLSVLKINDIVYGIPTYTAGNGVIINSLNQISIDETKIATLDSVKTMLSEATQNLTINAESVTVKNSSGEQVAVATTNLLTTGTESSKVDIGNYVFTEIE